MCRRKKTSGAHQEGDKDQAAFAGCGFQMGPSVAGGLRLIRPRREVGGRPEATVEVGHDLLIG
jgi:hypothetical protein